ncbi:MAG: hypothetical protein IPM57_09370 [Oligoflexia bacterium]|nr:hypothetical protein [Oligoflexia bacterium]
MIKLITVLSLLAISSTTSAEIVSKKTANEGLEQTIRQYVEYSISLQGGQPFQVIYLNPETVNLGQLKCGLDSSQNQTCELPFNLRYQCKYNLKSLIFYYENRVMSIRPVYQTNHQGCN